MNYLLLLIAVLATVLIPGVADVVRADDHGHAHHEGRNEEGGEHGDEHHSEGVVSLTPEVLRAAGVEFSQIGPAVLRTRLRVNGRISPISSNVAHITSRFPGIIKEVRTDVGERVKPGQVLAVIESNQNLQPFEVRSFQSGLVTDRHATLGEFAAEGTPLFVVADLSRLWADFTVFQRDATKLHEGRRVTIFSGTENPPLVSTLHFISPIVDETTQARLARAVLENPPRSLAPGAFITGEIDIEQFQVAVAVREEAIQSIDGRPTLFVRHDAVLQAVEVSIGRSDGEFVEVLSGVDVGATYASKGTFILKAELKKSEAEHEH